MTDELKQDLAERLRGDFMAVQRSKRGDAPLNMQPVWNIINAVPEVLAIFDGLTEFEQDLENEARNTPVTEGDEVTEAMKDAGIQAWKDMGNLETYIHDDEVEAIYRAMLATRPASSGGGD